MSTDDPKQRTSASLHESTIEKMEQYREANGLDNRSEAFEHMVETHPDTKSYGGVVTAILAVAGDELPLQTRQFAWFTIAAAVMTWMTGGAGLLAPLWGVLGAVFGFLMFTTLLGIIAGFIGIYDPDPSPLSDAAESGDEVDA